MDDLLISKKELLELTGISYGSLYRWKRKNLIPEDWFIRKSTFTGQETFFPREKILARIDKIKGMKENLSLDDVAGFFSPNPAGLSLDWSALQTAGIVHPSTLEVFQEAAGPQDTLEFQGLLQLYLMDQALQSGQVNREEAVLLAKTFSAHAREFDGRNAELILVRKLGVAMCLLAGYPNRLVFEDQARAAVRFELAGCAETLKLKLAQAQRRSDHEAGNQ